MKIFYYLPCNLPIMRKLEDIYRQGINAPSQNFTLADIGYVDIAQSTPTGIYPPLNDSINTVTVTGLELAEFLNFYNKKFVARFVPGPFREIAESFLPAALAGLYYAKSNNQLGGTFGVYDSGTFAPMLITPNIAYSGVANPTVRETWTTTVSTAGWNQGFFNVNLNVNVSGTPQLQLVGNVVATVFGVLDQTNPGIIEAVQLSNTAGNKLGVQYDVFSEFTTDQTIGLIPFDKSIVLGKTDSLAVDINFNRTGTARPILLGIAFVKKQYYTIE